MKTPVVSVIIPTYNRAHYLGTAIESVFNQTFQEFELIVVDDGSIDETRTLLDAIDDKRLIRLFREHKGISAAMNSGILVARGDYVARLDSDDVWMPEMLEMGAGILNSRPEVGLVYGKAQQMDRNENLQPNIRGNLPRFQRETLKSMLYGDFTCNIAILVRRECFDRVGLYDESMRTSEDWDMWLRVARHYEFAFVDQILARFRVHEGNTTHRTLAAFADYLEGRPRVLDKLFSRPDLPPAVQAMRPMAYERLYMGVGLCWLQTRQMRKALRSFGKAIRLSGNPVVSPVRIIWHTLVWEVLSKYSWGRRLVEWQAGLFTQWRSR